MSMSWQMTKSGVRQCVWWARRLQNELMPWFSGVCHSESAHFLEVYSKACLWICYTQKNACKNHAFNYVYRPIQISTNFHINTILFKWPYLKSLESLIGIKQTCCVVLCVLCGKITGGGETMNLMITVERKTSSCTIRCFKKTCSTCLMVKG